MSLRRSASAVLTLLLLMTGFLTAPTLAHAATLDTASEAVFLDSLNRERTSRGLAALRPVADLRDVARQHSVRMADQNRLYHNPSLSTDVSGWRSLAENVGYGGSAASVHTALMNSAGHRANILGAFAQVGIGAVRDASGRVWVTQVFRQPDASTAGLPSLDAPPPPPPAPAAPTEPGAARVGDVVQLAERAGDGSVSVRPVTSAGAGAPTALGGTALGAAAIASDGAGRLDVVVRGTDSGLWLRNQPRAGDPFGGWQSLGGVVTARPAVASWGPGRLDVVARGTDGALWHRVQFSPGVWSPWMSLGGQLFAGTGPAAVSSGPGELTVAVTGTDRQLWARSHSGGSWTGWAPLGGVVVGDPSAASPAAGEVVLAVRGTDNAGWVRSLRAGWTSLGGVLVQPPAAAATPGTGRVDVVGVGTDAALHRAVGANGAWQPWQRVT